MKRSLRGGGGGAMGDLWVVAKVESNAVGELMNEPVGGATYQPHTYQSHTYQPRHKSTCRLPIVLHPNSSL